MDSHTLRDKMSAWVPNANKALTRVHHKLVQKWSKRIRNGPNYRKGGKNFQKFEKFL